MSKTLVGAWNVEGSLSVNGSPVVGTSRFTFSQALPAATWVVTHNLGFYPSATIVDSAGSLVEGDVTYNSSDQLTVVFSAAFSGRCYCN